MVLSEAEMQALEPLASSVQGTSVRHSARGAAAKGQGKGKSLSFDNRLPRYGLVILDAFGCADHPIVMLDHRCLRAQWCEHRR